MHTSPTYLFYDLETTGLNPAFDQMLQFAAIRTDTTFKELERHEIRVRLRPDVIPSPGALLVTGVSILRAMEGASEYEAIRQIHALVNQQGTINLGYNSLNFDDQFLRFRLLSQPASCLYSPMAGWLQTARPVPHYGALLVARKPAPGLAAAQ